MKPGTMVLYTVKHWRWLVSVGRRHPKRKREQDWGHVTEVDYTGEAVCVRWHKGSVTWHFASNLETP
jgi:hypothetical protein